MYQIETGVPLPPRAACSKYPFNDMGIGDSFAVPITEKASKSLGAAARAATIKAGHADRRFSVRKNGEAVRIWRVA